VTPVLACWGVLGVLGALSSLLTDIRHRQRGSMEPVDSNEYAVKHRTCYALPALSKRFRCLLVRIGREPRMEQQRQQDLANHRQPLISTICSLLTGFRPLTSPALACAGQVKAIQGGGPRGKGGRSTMAPPQVPLSFDAHHPGLALNRPCVRRMH
jgi:hypothetical protein